METESSIWIHQSRMSPGKKLDPVGARKTLFYPCLWGVYNPIRKLYFIMKWDHVILIWQKQLQFRKLRAARAKMVQERVVQKHQKNPDPLRTAHPELGASNSILEPPSLHLREREFTVAASSPFHSWFPKGLFFISIFFLLQQVPRCITLDAVHIQNFWISSPFINAFTTEYSFFGLAL